ncbi:hypothetical protein FB451DRAFT_1303563 [Mycena latifolia]|nr:hypothetical protein FB451DRAFT_1303563 [Mycena latifolia]
MLGLIWVSFLAQTLGGPCVRVWPCPRFPCDSDAPPAMRRELPIFIPHSLTIAFIPSSSPHIFLRLLIAVSLVPPLTHFEESSPNALEAPATVWRLSHIRKKRL